MPERHFRRPGQSRTDSCFVVKDANGQALAYMYFEKEPLRRFRRRELLTRDEAQRFAAIFAKLPVPPSKKHRGIIVLSARGRSPSSASAGRNDLSRPTQEAC